MGLFNIPTMEDAATAKAFMNANYHAVADLASRVTDRFKSVPAQLGAQIIALSDEVKWVNEQSTGSSLGLSLPGGGPGWATIIARANAATETGNQIAGQLASMLGESNPTRSRETFSWSTVLAFGIAVVGGYFVYKHFFAQPEKYPRHLVPHYAGGRRRL